MCTRPTIYNLMLRQPHRCFKLSNVNWVFCLREDISSDIKPLGGVHLPKQLYLSTSPKCPSARMKFGIKSVHSRSSTLHFGVAKCIKNMLNISFGLSKGSCSLRGPSLSNIASPVYIKSDRFPSEQASMTLFSHEDKAILITNSMTDKEKAWKETTLKITAFRGEFGWKIAVNMNSALAVRILIA